MAGQSTVLLLLVGIAFAAALNPTRHLRSLVSKRDACDVMSCVMPLMKYENPTTGFKLSTLDESEILDQVCSDLDTATQCISSKASSCPHQDPNVQLMVDTLEGVVGYMCSAQGKDALLSEPECWDNPELEMSIELCTDLERNSDHFNYASPCSILEFVRTCINDKVNEVCSSKAVDFVDGLVYHALKPTADFHFGGCDLRPPTQKNIVNILRRAVQAFRK